jgi:hypothetical protein
MRVAKVVGILLALGACSGAIVGVLVALGLMVFKFRDPVLFGWDFYGAAAAFGAAVGAVMGPPIAFVFLRRVPLWRATVQVAGAAGLGAALGARLDMTLGWALTALVMALTMALVLRYQYRNRTQPVHAE